MAGLILPDADWRHRPGMDALLDALDAGAGETRFVGGAVRDTLAGRPVSDIDLATRIRPERLVERIRAAGLKPVPTGIAHGTVTAVLPGSHVEVTTLRRDVSTDGRRATVAYSDDWREDAARRDFTINALYADPASGAIHDYFGGVDDLEAGVVRFIGEPLERIAEDHLRILRFFRFHARYGRGAPESAAYAACAARANDLMALSRERIADELLKLLASDDPAPAIALMLDRAILRPVLPEIDRAGLARLEKLVGDEQQNTSPTPSIPSEVEGRTRPGTLRPSTSLGMDGLGNRSARGTSADPLLRLIALLPADPAAADGIAARLKLSNAQRKRIAAALSGDAGDPDRPQALAAVVGARAAIDRLLLHGHREAAARLAGWEQPAFPIGGEAMLAHGLRGPQIARALKAIRARWVDEDFPDRDRVAAIAEEVVVQLLLDSRKSSAASGSSGLA